MRYDENAYLELFPRKETQAKPKPVVESACETFKPSENTEQLNNESAVEVPIEEENDGVDGNDIGADS